MHGPKLARPWSDASLSPRFARSADPTASLRSATRGAIMQLEQRRVAAAAREAQVRVPRAGKFS
eukprot:1038853-Lingulodinium_polyedra.AAC.1